MKKFRKVLPVIAVVLFVIAVAAPAAAAKPQKAPLASIVTQHLWDDQFQAQSGDCGPWYNDVSWINQNNCGFVDFDDYGWISRLEDFEFSTMPMDTVFKIDIETSNWQWSTHNDWIVTVGARDDYAGTWQVAYFENCGSLNCSFECRMTGFSPYPPPGGQGTEYADAFAIGAIRNGAAGSTLRVIAIDVDVVLYFHPDDFTGPACDMTPP